jgi:hypothetical protein
LPTKSGKSWNTWITWDAVFTDKEFGTGKKIRAPYSLSPGREGEKGGGYNKNASF